MGQEKLSMFIYMEANTAGEGRQDTCGHVFCPDGRFECEQRSLRDEPEGENDDFHQKNKQKGVTVLGFAAYDERYNPTLKNSRRARGRGRENSGYRGARRGEGGLVSS